MKGGGVMMQPVTGQSDEDLRQRYLDSLYATQWEYRDRVFPQEGHLFRPDQARLNPPVFLKDHADRNVLVPPDPALAEVVLAFIPAGRQKWFGSMRSSQALALPCA